MKTDFASLIGATLFMLGAACAGVSDAAAVSEEWADNSGFAAEGTDSVSGVPAEHSLTVDLPPDSAQVDVPGLTAAGDEVSPAYEGELQEESDLRDLPNQESSLLDAASPLQQPAGSDFLTLPSAGGLVESSSVAVWQDSVEVTDQAEELNGTAIPEPPGIVLATVLLLLIGLMSLLRRQFDTLSVEEQEAS